MVDDDEDDRSLFMEAVQRIDESAECVCIDNCEDALRLLKSVSNSVFNYIFLDLNIPRINGKQCLREIKKIEQARAIPVVIYTTSNLEKDKKETKELGAAYYFTKPNTFTELVNIVGNLVSGKAKKLCETY
jgi:DNA-binding response OmpR family regulator